MLLPPRFLGALCVLVLTMAGLAVAPPTAAAPPRLVSVASVKASAVTTQGKTRVEVRTIVRNLTRGRTARRTLTLFLRSSSGATTRIGQDKVPAMARGARVRVRTRIRLAPAVAPGRYRILACPTRRPGSACRATARAAVTVPGAVLDATSRTLGFPNADVGTTSAPRTVTLRNTGAGTTGRLRVSVTGPFRRAGGTCGPSLSPRAACTLAVVHAPTVAGRAHGTLTVTGGTSGRTTIALSGTGLAGPLLTFEEATTDFGAVAAQRPSIRQLILTNHGDAATGSLQITTGGPHFTVTGTDCTTLAAGASCEATVRFAPSATGALTDALSVTPVTDGADGEVVASTALTGTGARGLTIDRDFHDFGLVAAGTSQTTTFTLSNDTDVSEPLTRLDATGRYAVTGGTCVDAGNSVPAQGACTIVVTFTPLGNASAQAGSLVAENDAYRASAFVQGRARLLSINPSTVNFGSVRVGTTSPTITITVTNRGAVVLSSHSKGASGGFDVVQTSNDCMFTSNLQPGATCTMAVRFTPPTTGGFGGSLIMTFSAGGTINDSTRTSAALRGSGIDPSPV